MSSQIKKVCKWCGNTLVSDNEYDLLAQEQECYANPEQKSCLSCLNQMSEVEDNPLFGGRIKCKELGTVYLREVCKCEHYLPGGNRYCEQDSETCVTISTPRIIIFGREPTHEERVIFDRIAGEILEETGVEIETSYVLDNDPDKIPELFLEGYHLFMDEPYLHVQDLDLDRLKDMIISSEKYSKKQDGQDE